MSSVFSLIATMQEALAHLEVLDEATRAKRPHSIMLDLVGRGLAVLYAIDGWEPDCDTALDHWRSLRGDQAFTAAVGTGSAIPMTRAREPVSARGGVRSAIR